MIQLLLEIIAKYKKKFLVYFFIGGFCAIVNWVSFYLLITYTSVPYISAAILSFILSCYINFIMCRKIFIPSARRKATEFLLIIAASTIAAGIDISAMICFIEFFKWNVMLSKILGTGVAFLFNYASRQFYIYRENN